MSEDRKMTIYTMGFTQKSAVFPGDRGAEGPPLPKAVCDFAPDFSVFGIDISPFPVYIVPVRGGAAPLAPLSAGRIGAWEE